MKITLYEIVMFKLRLVGKILMTVVNIVLLRLESGLKRLLLDLGDWNCSEESSFCSVSVRCRSETINLALNG